MEIEKCSICNGEIYGAIGDEIYCVKHYVQNYKKDKRFLIAQMEKLMDAYSREQILTKKEKEFLIKQQFCYFMRKKDF